MRRVTAFLRTIPKQPTGTAKLPSKATGTHRTISVSCIRAVEAFLNDQIEWSRIVPLVADVLDQYEPDPLDTVEALFANDATARRLAGVRVPR